MEVRDVPREECGVVGISSTMENVAQQAFFGLFALQHRGQEAAGIAVADGSMARLHKDVGLVGQVFTPETLAPLVGSHAIGHTRPDGSRFGRRMIAHRQETPGRSPTTAVVPDSYPVHALSQSVPAPHRPRNSRARYVDPRPGSVRTVRSHRSTSPGVAGSCRNSIHTVGADRRSHHRMGKRGHGRTDGRPQQT